MEALLGLIKPGLEIQRALLYHAVLADTVKFDFLQLRKQGLQFLSILGVSLLTLCHLEEKLTLGHLHDVCRDG